MAPVGLFLVTVMLFFFRRVYCEVVTAIPVNGGSYNAILNTSTKRMAAIVGCLSLLSYTATAIVSAFDSMLYLSIIWTAVGMCCYNAQSYLCCFVCIYSIPCNMYPLYRYTDRDYCGAMCIRGPMLPGGLRVLPRGRVHVRAAHAHPDCADIVGLHPRVSGQLPVIP